jgi:hypothetical protein
LGPAGHTFVYDAWPQNAVADPSHAVLLLHGLGGSHASGYLVRIAHRLLEAGLRVVRIDLPGCGPSITLTDMPAHAGCSHELRTAMDWCQGALKIRRWSLAGFSLGGNVALKLLCELAQEADGRPHGRVRPLALNVDRAVVVAPPVDLRYCCDQIEKGFSRIYTKHFARHLRQLARDRVSLWPRWAERARAPHRRIKTIRQFDQQYTAPIAGFGSADEYYAESSTHQLVRDVVTPISVLVDRHDPIVVPSVFDKTPWPASARITYTQYGGHLGYFYRDSQRRLQCWMDQWVVQQLVSRLR